MLGSITPVGETARGARWGITVTNYLIGSLISGALVGAAFGWLGSLIPALAGAGSWAALWVLAAIVALGVLFDIPLTGLRLPTVHRQVDDGWLYRYRGWFYGMGFGLQLGAGFVTIVTTAAVYSTLAASFLVASPALGALIGAVFGLVRASSIFAGARAHTSEQVIALDGAFLRWDSRSKLAAIAGQGALGAAALLAGVAGKVG